MSDKTTKNGFFISKGEGYVGIHGKDILTPPGRIAFVNLVTPTGSPTPKYGLSLLVDKNDQQAQKQLAEIKTMGKLMAVDLWGENAGTMIKKIKRPIFGDGDEPSSTGKTYEGYPGNLIINARNKNNHESARGFKIHGNMLPDQFQSGMICWLIVQPYLNADGFSYTLRGVKLKEDDGKRFGGAPDPSGLFDALGEAESAVKDNSFDMGILG
jgi:hypothetical protein